MERKVGIRDLFGLAHDLYNSTQGEIPIGVRVRVSTNFTTRPKAKSHKLAGV